MKSQGWEGELVEAYGTRQQQVARVAELTGGKRAWRPEPEHWGFWTARRAALVRSLPGRNVHGEKVAVSL